jgi:type III secretory pathway lipoprotein EscJ
MSGSMVQVALAEGVSEAEEIQALLAEAGIESQLETAVETHPRAVDDAPQKVLVPEESVEAAVDAIEALTEPDEPTGDV